MEYVTVSMIAKQAGKGRNTVTIALKRAGVKVERSPGVRGLRITKKDANRFLAKQWPEVEPFRFNELR